MSFGEWKAYAGRENFGQDLSLNIGREVAHREWEMVTQIDSHGTVVNRMPEADEGTVPQPTLRMPFEVAEVLYRALDRVFGTENTDGKVEALQAALEKEQARVDLIITRALGIAPKRNGNGHQFDGPVPQ